MNLPRSLAQVVRGVLMGAADIVPGVSGGTVALVLGIYHRLITNVRDGARALASLVRLDIRESVARLRAVEWGFLIPLAAGIGIAIVALSSIIETLLEEQPVRMAALFSGLVIGSIYVASRLVRGWDAPRVALLAVTAVVTFVVLGFRSGPLEDPALWVFFLCGAIAICAMILPGISGSFLLLMLGMYDNVLGAVTDRDVVTLGVFALGCVLGLALFSQGLHWGLVHHERTVLAALIGLMAGSLRVLWPWPDGTEGTTVAWPADDVVVPIALAVVGAAVVVVITKVAARFEHRTDEDLRDELQQP
jgi:putative membrane protein